MNFTGVEEEGWKRERLGGQLGSCCDCPGAGTEPLNQDTGEGEVVGGGSPCSPPSKTAQLSVS